MERLIRYLTSALMLLLIAGCLDCSAVTQQARRDLNVVEEVNQTNHHVAEAFNEIKGRYATPEQQRLAYIIRIATIRAFGEFLYEHLDEDEQTISNRISQRLMDQERGEPQPLPQKESTNPNARSKEMLQTEERPPVEGGVCPKEQTLSF